MTYTEKIKERPIIFTGESIPAILRNHFPKTQTRRIINPPPSGGVRSSPFVASGLEDRHGRELRCRYGVPGDRLWVREAALPDFPKEFSYYDWSWREVPEEYRTPKFVLYRAGYPEPDKIRWHPSIFMPRWASRLTLEIISVRAERLQDISATDVEAEGTPLNPMQQMSYRNDSYQRIRDFAWIWESIHGKGAWDRNDWVWVIEFKMLEVING